MLCIMCIYFLHLNVCRLEDMMRLLDVEVIEAGGHVDGGAAETQTAQRLGLELRDGLQGLLCNVT